MTNKHEKAPSLLGTGPGAEGGTRRADTLSSTPAPSPAPNRPAADQRTGLDESEILRLASLPAGREMDRAVAEHVLGWVHDTFLDRAPDWWQDGKGHIKATNLPKFSTNLDASATVLDHAVAQGWGPKMADSSSGGWVCTMHKWRTETWSVADTLPLAICRAALKAALYGKKEVTA